MNPRHLTDMEREQLAAIRANARRERRRVEREEGRALNCCANCSHEATCGYSPLAMLKKRTDSSFAACPLGPLYFTIQLAADLAAPNAGQGYDGLQLCFTVTDLEAFVRRLQDLKITPLHPPKPFEFTTYVTLLDPDGRHVRVMTPWRREGAG